MGFRTCEKCGESADAAKAFCPGCGEPFVAEKERVKTSEFDASGSTVQFSQTAFNMVLSDMGLNISEAPNRPSKPSVKTTLAPAAATPALKPETEKSGSKIKWILIGAAVFLVLSVTVVIVAAAVIYLYLKPA